MLTFIIALVLKKPVLITQYAKIINYPQFYKRALQHFAYLTIGRIMFSYADKVVFITKNVRDNMQQITPNLKYDVVPLGVDTEIFFPIEAEKRAT